MGALRASHVVPVRRTIFRALGIPKCRGVDLSVNSRPSFRYNHHDDGRLAFCR